MNNEYIAIFDSGIGGFSCLISAAKKLYGEKFLYLGDNKNAPYGNKPLRELYLLTEKNLAEILKYNVKVIIFGCNTLSASILPIIAKICPVPVFGVYPPVQKRMGKTVLFATPITCARYKNTKNLILNPLKMLAADIERNKYNLSKVDITNHISNVDLFSPDLMILGCTHYFFVKNQFIDHFCPQKVISGEDYTATKVQNFVVGNRLTAKNKTFNVDFIGENAEENYKFYNEVVKNMIFQK